MRPDRLIAVLSAVAVAAGILVPAPAGALTSQLTRYPYLTDLVGTSVTVSWATDRSGTSASATWGAVDGGGGCVPTNTVTAARTSITVNGVSEYQWVAVLALPAAGTYCYRVFLGATDLLGSDASPRFKTQVPAGSTAPFSFAVFGDWGWVDANGANADQANLMSRIATSGVNFAVTVGDNGYQSGSQTNYGDLQQSGAYVSEIFGPSFWTVPGRSIPLFAANGNHGMTGGTTTATRSTEQVNWPQSVAVSTSGGRYQKETYCCVNGTSSASYPSSWYAFDAGGSRFYVLQADWADSNVGTGTVYSDDYAARWSRNSPEYQWLAADLADHPSGLKFAFFHYPLYSDQKAQTSDPYLQGSNSLEGLLATNHVSLAFNGHAHIYERNAPTKPGSFPSYVTGGGGAFLQPVAEAGCSAFDAYAIGWSPTKLRGSSCGAAPVPDSATRVYHFLKVTVDGSTVTVTPTDELGRTFDVQTYSFSSLPDTVIDDGPDAVTNVSSATFAFHATQSPATFRCRIDAAAAAPCSSPVTYSGLSDGNHSFSVQATSESGTDLSPATATWKVDTTPPDAPSALAAAAPTSAAVNLTWTAATDANGIAGYDIARNGAALASVSGSATSYSDTAVAANTTYQYRIVARDPAGNVSAPSNVAGVTTPPAASGGGPRLVQAAGSTTNTVTLATPTTAGDLLLLSAGVYSGATNQITSVTDSAGNPWTRIGAFASPGHFSDGEMWYSANAGSTSSVTVRTSTATNMAVEVLEFSGVATTAPLDVSAGAANTGNAPSSGSVNPSAPNDLVVGFIAGHGNGQAITVTAPGYTTQPQQTTGASVASVITGYQVLTSASAQTFTGSFASSMYWAAGIAAFKSAG